MSGTQNETNETPKKRRVIYVSEEKVALNLWLRAIPLLLVMRFEVFPRVREGFRELR